MKNKSLDRKLGNSLRYALSPMPYAVIFALCAMLFASFAYSADKLVVKDSSDVTQFVVTDTGQVGVGIAVPDQKIHVRKDQNAITALRVENGNIIGAASPLAQELFVLGPSGNEHLMLQVLSDSHATLPRVALINAYTHDLFFRTNAKNVLKVIRTGAVADTLVLNTGNVGLGTAAPTQKLEVNGGMKLSTATAKPDCSNANANIADVRGTFWFTQGGAGIKDTVEVCAKAANDQYAWRTLY